MSGFVDLVLEPSGNKITLSKTSVLFIEENLDKPQVTHLHCLGGITHVVNGAYQDVVSQFPKFFSTSRKNTNVKVSINDWNLSYIEKSGEDILVFFTENGASISAANSYEEITNYFHSL